MRPSLLLPTIACAAALAVVATGCGASGGDVAAEDPSTTEPSPTGPTEPETDGIPPDQVVWQESSSGGFVPMEAVAAEVPTVTIYGDGRVIVRSPEETSYDHPAALSVDQIPADDLEAFIADARASGLFERDADLGQPGVTDMDTTSVTLNDGSGPPATVDAYALTFGGGEAGNGPIGISAEQAELRQQLRELLSRARALGDGGEAYVPTQVRATMFDETTYVPPGSPAAVTWPGPSFGDFPEPVAGSGTSCLVIDETKAAEVYRAARANEGTRWTDGGEERTIVVAPLVPGQDGCPPS